MENAGFGDGISWMWLRRVDNVTRHGGREDNGATCFAGDDVPARFLSLFRYYRRTKGQSYLATARATRKEPCRLTSTIFLHLPIS